MDILGFTGYICMTLWKHVISHYTICSFKPGKTKHSLIQKVLLEISWWLHMCFCSGLPVQQDHPLPAECSSCSGFVTASGLLPVSSLSWAQYFKIMAGFIRLKISAWVPHKIFNQFSTLSQISRVTRNTSLRHKAYFFFPTTPKNLYTCLLKCLRLWT